MEDKGKIQDYVNSFRSLMGGHLRPQVGMKFNLFPVITSGALVEIELAPHRQNEEVYYPPSTTLSEALSKIKQKAFGGDTSGFRFSGTNVILDQGRIVLIKGDDDDLAWSVIGAKKDIDFIMKSSSSQTRRGM